MRIPSAQSEVVVERRASGRFSRAGSETGLETPERSGPGSRSIPWAVLAATVLGGAFVFWASRGLTFTLDEWDFVQRRSGGAPLVDDLLVPHNQHLLALVALIYKGLFATAGLDDYWAYRLVAVFVHLVCVLLLFQVARHRIGDSPAAFVVLPILVLGSSWLVLLYPFNVQLSLAVAALLGVLVLLDRDDRRYDPAICALLVLAVLSASPGPPVAMGVLAAFVLGRGWRRLWVPIVPLALYGTWFLVYGIDAQANRDYVPKVAPGYLWDTVAGSVGALLGVPLGLHAVADRPYLGLAIHLLGLGLGIALLYNLVAGKQRFTPQLVLLLTTAAAFWGVLSVTRAFSNAPYHPNYIYVGGFLVLLLGLESLRGRTVPGRVRRGLALMFCVAAALNAAVLVHFSDVRRRDATLVIADVSALEIAGPRIDPTFKPDSSQDRAPTITAGLYFPAVDRLDSSPALTPEALAKEPEYARARADAVLVRALPVVAGPYTKTVADLLLAARPNVGGVELDDTAPGSTSRRAGSCVVLDPGTASRPAMELTLPLVGAVVSATSPVDVRLRRFAGRYPSRPLATVDGRAYISAPLGEAPHPWHMRVSGADQVRAC